MKITEITKRNLSLGNWTCNPEVWGSNHGISKLLMLDQILPFVMSVDSTCIGGHWDCQIRSDCNPEQRPQSGNINLVMISFLMYLALVHIAITDDNPQILVSLGWAHGYKQKTVAAMSNELISFKGWGTIARNLQKQILWAHNLFAYLLINNWNLLEFTCTKWRRGTKLTESFEERGLRMTFSCAIWGWVGLSGFC